MKGSWPKVAAWEAAMRITGVSVLERFCLRAASAQITERGCWEWPSTFKTGYGYLNEGGYKKLYAHRYSYELFNGAIPAGFEVMHSCDNPACVNPSHLVAGTHLQNMLDVSAKGRWNDRRGVLCGTAKLDDAQVLEIRRLSAQGVRQCILAKQFGVTPTNIRSIAKRDTWRHI